MKKLLCYFLTKTASKQVMVLSLISCCTLLNVSFAFEDNLANQAAKKGRNGQVVQKTNLLKQPNYQSEVSGSVDANKNITIQTRERAWYLISTKETSQAAQLSGWVNMLNVRFVATVKREGELGVQSLFSSVNNDTLPTVSTGIRGFDVDDIKKAKADLKQVALLNTYAVSAGAAVRFAKQGKLQANKIKVKQDE